MMQTLALDGKLHDRNGFDCGVTALNSYLKTLAGQQSKRDNARTYILPATDNPSHILGYYTVSLTQIDLANLPTNYQKRHPTAHSAGLIARLAVDHRHTGRGYGSWLLIDALSRLAQASEVIGFPLIVVDAKPGARAFYTRFGFRSFLDAQDHLNLRVAEVKASLAAPTTPSKPQACGA
ncbi:MAG: GNAT family N-acetyltransferase [Gammaproteobacteria bacterium SHHR-1]